MRTDIAIGRFAWIALSNDQTHLYYLRTEVGLNEKKKIKKKEKKHAFDQEKKKKENKILTRKKKENKISTMKSFKIFLLFFYKFPSELFNFRSTGGPESSPKVRTIITSIWMIITSYNQLG